MWVGLLFGLLPLHPRLESSTANAANAANAAANAPLKIEPRPFFPQLDEFPLEWQSVYAQLLPAAELDDFWAWAMKHACSPPRRLAVELEPFNLLVCARKCRIGRVPVLKFASNGTRFRECKTFRV